jgi:hypothetical protein
MSKDVAGLDYGESRETLTTDEMQTRTLREAATKEPWSFKRGTLRERLEWCRVQHELGAEWLDGVAAMPPESRPANPPKPAEWHRACADWYAEMVRDLDRLIPPNAILIDPTTPETVAALAEAIIAADDADPGVLHAVGLDDSEAPAAAVAILPAFVARLRGKP